jgi:hypothetical protein
MNEGKDRSVVIAFLIGIAISCFLIKIGSESFSIGGLGLNLLPELIGAAFATFAIDALIKRREEARNYEAKFLAYKKINLVLSGFIWLWRDLYRVSVPGPEPESLREFLSPGTFNSIWNCLDLDQGPNEGAPALPPNMASFIFAGTYWEFIPNRLNKTQKAVLEITDRFGPYLEPEVYSKLNELIEAGYFKALVDLKLSKASYDNRATLPPGFDTRPVLLCWGGSRSRPTQADFEVMLYLHKWCLRNYDYYWVEKSEELVGVTYQNFRYRGILRRSITEVPPHMITYSTIFRRRPHL